MNTGHRLPPHIVERLNAALKSAAMETASFDQIDDGKAKGRQIYIRGATDAEPRLVFEGTVTDFIRDRTRLFRASWIVAPINAVLEWSGTPDDGSQGEYKLTDRLRAPLPHPQNLTDAAKRIDWLEQKCAALEGFLRDVGKKGGDVSTLIDVLNEQDIPQ